MLFIETNLPGAFVIDIEERRDPRGFFARTYCQNEFAEHGLVLDTVQCSIAFNVTQGTLRGMHYQTMPAPETKLIRCTKGAIYDVIIDMRPESPTYLAHFAIQLCEGNHRMLYVPEMFAHGYQTLTDNAEVEYQMGTFYAPDCSRGVRYDDPAVGIEWPLPVSVISPKDQEWPLLGIEKAECLRPLHAAR
jgi:dTDP-4-dehydrorhamnose 3,5-epimerase